MNIDELCAAVNRALDEEGVEVADGRVSPIVTPRHVRYYRTIGLLDAPRREAGRAVYDDGHLSTIVWIKRAQANGITLDAMRPRREALDTRSILARQDRWMNASTVTHMKPVEAELTTFAHRFATEDLLFRSEPSRVDPPGSSAPDLGWSVRIDDAVLSGFGTPPNAEQVGRIRAILNDEPDDG